VGVIGSTLMMVSLSQRWFLFSSVVGDGFAHPGQMAGIASVTSSGRAGDHRECGQMPETYRARPEPTPVATKDPQAHCR